MSGSSGSTLAVWDSVESCEQLIIESQLSSPKEEIVGQIQEGDVLQVTVMRHGDKSIVVLTFNNVVAGGIASPKLQRLRECIELGTNYQATVTSKNDGQVRVKIGVVK